MFRRHFGNRIQTTDAMLTPEPAEGEGANSRKKFVGQLVEHAAGLASEALSSEDRRISKDAIRDIISTAIMRAADELIDLEEHPESGLTRAKPDGSTEGAQERRAVGDGIGRNLRAERRGEEARIAEFNAAAAKFWNGKR